MSAATMTDSVQTYAMRLGRAERLGIPSSALGPDWLKANEHWRRVLSRPDAEDLRAQYVAAYRKARWECDASHGDPQRAVDVRFLSEAPQPWRAEAALVKRSAEGDSRPAPLEQRPGSAGAPIPSSPPSAPASAPMPLPPAMPAKVKVGDTTADVTSTRSPALPFRPAHQVSLTLEQHAAYFAELALWPSSANAIHARYHLQDEARRLAELRHWALRRQQDSALNARWEALFTTYTRYYAAR